MQNSVRWGLVLQDELRQAPTPSKCDPAASFTSHSRRRTGDTLSRTARQNRKRQSSSVAGAEHSRDNRTDSVPLEDWEKDAVSLYRCVKKRYQPHDAKSASTDLLASPSSPSNTLFLFTVLDAMSARGLSPSAPTATAEASSAYTRVPSCTPFLLSFFLRTAVLTTDTVAENARECAGWLWANAMKDVSVTRLEASTDEAMRAISASLVTIAVALRRAGRLSSATVTAQWLLGVFRHLSAARSHQLSSLAASCEDWKLAEQLVESVHHLQGAFDDSETDWAMLSCQLYVTALQVILDEWDAIAASLTAGPHSDSERVCGMLKLCVSLRQHPSYCSPALVGDSARSDQYYEMSAAVETPTTACLGLTELLAIKSSWQCLTHLSLTRADAISRSPVVLAMTLSYLLSQ